jgi:hypothetical protein
MIPSRRIVSPIGSALEEQELGIQSFPIQKVQNMVLRTWLSSTMAVPLTVFSVKIGATKIEFEIKEIFHLRHWFRPSMREQVVSVISVGILLHNFPIPSRYQGWLWRRLEGES